MLYFYRGRSVHHCVPRKNHIATRYTLAFVPKIHLIWCLSTFVFSHQIWTSTLHSRRLLLPILSAAISLVRLVLKHSSAYLKTSILVWTYALKTLICFWFFVSSIFSIIVIKHLTSDVNKNFSFVLFCFLKLNSLFFFKIRNFWVTLISLEVYSLFLWNRFSEVLLIASNLAMNRRLSLLLEWHPKFINLAIQLFLSL